MIRVWLGVALSLSLVVGGFLGYRSAARAGYESGAAAVRAEWGAERLAREQAQAEALSAAQTVFRRDLAIREGIERELSAKLDVADRRGADLARRLRLAQARPLPPGPGDGPATPAPDGSSGVSSDPDPVGIALAAHLSACERDATRLTELQDFIRATEKP